MNTVSCKSLFAEVLSAAVLTALLSLPTASLAQGGNTATGINALFLNQTGVNNTADGYYALVSNNSGVDNTATGYEALYSNTTGWYNSATGFYALFSNTSGYSNTANGVSALFSNTTGNNNMATGGSALYSNTTGSYNNAYGYESLAANTIGQYNSATGQQTLYYNTTGSFNTANGVNALYFNLTGQSNTANGLGALYRNITGNNNTADGYFALLNSTTGSYNVALGNGAGDAITTGSYNIDIGSEGGASDSGTIRIGDISRQTQTYIAGISGVGVTGAQVYITANGQLGILKSSARFKYDIQDLGASNKLMNLHPVTFRYKEAAEDGTHPLQYGLIAEEVAKVYPALVQYDKSGKPFTVYYHLLTPIMLKELQNAHQKIDTLEAKQQNQAVALTSQNSTLQSQSAEMSSLRHTVQMLVMSFTVFVLLTLGTVAYIFVGKTRRQGFLPLRRQQFENLVS